jgi:hypothetical protein
MESVFIRSPIDNATNLLVALSIGCSVGPNNIINWFLVIIRQVLEMSKDMTSFGGYDYVF